MRGMEERVRQRQTDTDRQTQTDRETQTDRDFHSTKPGKTHTDSYLPMYEKMKFSIRKLINSNNCFVRC